jgi:hypothetical protein
MKTRAHEPRQDRNRCRAATDSKIAFDWRVPKTCEREDLDPQATLVRQDGNHCRGEMKADAASDSEIIDEGMESGAAFDWKVGC